MFTTNVSKYRFASRKLGCNSYRFLSATLPLTALVSLLAFTVLKADAQVTLMDIGTTDPAFVSVNDIYQFSTVGNTAGADVVNNDYYNDSGAWGDGDSGQTFTTGNLSGGHYLLTSVSI